MVILQAQVQDHDVLSFTVPPVTASPSQMSCRPRTSAGLPPIRDLAWHTEDLAPLLPRGHMSQNQTRLEHFDGNKNIFCGS